MITFYFCIYYNNKNKDSSGTGPSFDHTFQSPYGWYMYIGKDSKYANEIFK
jgi:hypothetical protein